MTTKSHKRSRIRRGVVSLDYVLTMCVVIPATFLLLQLLVRGLSGLFRFSSDALGWLPF